MGKQKIRTFSQERLLVVLVLIISGSIFGYAYLNYLQVVKTTELQKQNNDIKYQELLLKSGDISTKENQLKLDRDKLNNQGSRLPTCLEIVENEFDYDKKLIWDTTNARLLQEGCGENDVRYACDAIKRITNDELDKSEAKYIAGRNVCLSK